MEKGEKGSWEEEDKEGGEDIEEWAKDGMICVAGADDDADANAAEGADSAGDDNDADNADDGGNVEDEDTDGGDSGCMNSDGIVVRLAKEGADGGGSSGILNNDDDDDCDGVEGSNVDGG